MEFTLLGAALLAAGAIWVTIRILGRSDSVPFRDIDQFDVLLGAAVVGLAVGRLASMVETGTNPLTHLSLIPLVRGGVHPGWATIGALVWLAWFGRRRDHRWSVFDVLAVPSLAGLAGWEAGCLIRSSCLGTATDVVWGVAGSSGVGRHPVGIYAAAGLLVVAVVAGRWITRCPRPGVVAGFALASAALVRLAVEPFRAGLGAGPVIWYSCGLVVGLVVMAWRGSSRTRPEPPSEVESGRLGRGEDHSEHDGEDLRKS